MDAPDQEPEAKDPIPDEILDIVSEIEALLGTLRARIENSGGSRG